MERVRLPRDGASWRCTWRRRGAEDSCHRTATHGIGSVDEWYQAMLFLPDVDFMRSLCESHLQRVADVLADNA